MKYLLLLAFVISLGAACNNPDQNSATGNSADVRDTSSTGTNPNTNVDDSTGHHHAEGDTSHHH